MDLQPGAQLAHYRLIDKIGEGGMGVVWKALDTTLDREVAIKVLPEAFAADPTRLERFQREARLLASLNHPNIAGLFGLHCDQGVNFLTMELIPGEDLSQRLQRGALPSADVIRIGLQIAEGLETAHESGIIHRDLKPANIKISPTGEVKILDFGLAKAMASESGDADASVTQSPTITALATQAGVLMGTAAYMSPEQARGEAVDKRADIWAFGCILIEMLSGRGTFTERTISDTLASVLKSDPNWDDLPADLPAPLRKLMRRMLQKDARLRLRDAGEARILLDDLQSGRLPEADTGQGMPATTTRHWQRAAVFMMTVIATAAMTSLAWNWMTPAPAPDLPFKTELIGAELEADDRFAPALSPDGRRLIFSGQDRLWIRDLGDLEAIPLPGGEDGSFPFWSPDGRSIGFLHDRNIVKMDMDGGGRAIVATRIGAPGMGSGFTWTEDDHIIFSRADGDGLFKVSVRGGDPQVILEPERELESDFHHPHRLPGTNAILFVAHRIGTGAVALYALHNGRRKLIHEYEHQAIWAPVYSPTGHIIYHLSRGNEGLWALPFSLAKMEATGLPFMVVSDGNYPQAAADGTLVYVKGAGTGLRQMAWVDRQGKLLGPVGEAQSRIIAPALSPDGTRVVVTARDQEDWGLWIHDVQRGTRSRLNFTGSQDWDPTWMPDGENVVFWEATSRAISMLSADGTGTLTRLVKEQFVDTGDPTISPDGRTMLFWAEQTDVTANIYELTLDGEEGPVPFLQSEDELYSPVFSPDGSLVAYASDETGQNEIFLTRYPGARGKWQVSTQGGDAPRWHPDGTALYYLRDGNLMETEVTTEPSLRLGRPRELFSADDAGVWIAGTMRFDVAPDGDRFLMVTTERGQETQASLILIRNWLTEFTDDVSQ